MRNTEEEEWVRRRGGEEYRRRRRGKETRRRGISSEKHCFRFLEITSFYKESKILGLIDFEV